MADEKVFEIISQKKLEKFLESIYDNLDKLDKEEAVSITLSSPDNKVLVFIIASHTEDLVLAFKEALETSIANIKQLESQENKTGYIG